MARGASLRQYNGAESTVPSLVLTQRFIYVKVGSVVEVSRIRSILVTEQNNFKKRNAASIRRVLPIRQDITYSFCCTGAETEIHKIKDDSKIDREKNINRHGPRQIGSD
jgi:hypothetical protein